MKEKMNRKGTGNFQPADSFNPKTQHDATVKTIWII